MIEYPTLRDANRARQREWDTGNQITMAYRGNELAGEVGEACNVLKKLERERLGIRGSRATIDQLAEELADVIICADLIAMDAGIDLELAVRNKFNATSEKVGLQTIMAEPFTDPDYQCEGCLKYMAEGTPAYRCDDGPVLCGDCSPTYGDALKNMEGNENLDPDDLKAFLECKDTHLSAGGSLDDKLPLTPL